MAQINKKCLKSRNTRKGTTIGNQHTKDGYEFKPTTSPIEQLQPIKQTNQTLLAEVIAQVLRCGNRARACWLKSDDDEEEEADEADEEEASSLVIVRRWSACLARKRSAFEVTSYLYVQFRKLRQESTRVYGNEATIYIAPQKPILHMCSQYCA